MLEVVYLLKNVSYQSQPISELFHLVRKLIYDGFSASYMLAVRLLN